MKRLTIGVFLLIGILSPSLLAQNKVQKKFQYLDSIGKVAMIAPAKLEKIKELYTQQEDRIALYQKDSQKQDVTSLIFFFDQKFSPQESRRLFKENLSKVITRQEFEVLFGHALAGKVTRETQKKWTAFKENYDLSKKEEEILHKIIQHYESEEVFIWEYNNWDRGIALSKVKASRAEGKAALEKALIGLKLKNNPTRSSDPKLDYFISQAQKAGVSGDKINKLTSAMAVRDQTIAEYGKTFQEFDKKYLVYFHDNKHTKQTAYLAFRKTMASLITYDQFVIMFKEQLAERIKLQAVDKIAEIKAAYIINFEQEQQLSKMLKQQAEKEIMTLEYYGYNQKLSVQKLRGVQFRFDKKYRDTLQSMNLAPKN